MTRTVSKKVRRFLWAGRVVMKKLERATQQKLEMVKERKESRNPTAPITSSSLILSKTYTPYLPKHIMFLNWLRTEDSSARSLTDAF